MPEMSIHYTVRCKPKLLYLKNLQIFLQGIVNRYTIGNMRYGQPSTKRQYLSYLEKELDKYKKTGNVEQLWNIGVYCFLELICPEHPNAYFDPAAKSATRKEDIKWN